MSTQVKKELRDAYFVPWCQKKYITEFAKDLLHNKEELLEDGITINEERMMQHCMENIYNCELYTMEQFMH